MQKPRSRSQVLKALMSNSSQPKGHVKNFSEDFKTRGDYLGEVKELQEKGAMSQINFVFTFRYGRLHLYPRFVMFWAH